MITSISQAWTQINNLGDAIKIGLHLKNMYDDWNTLCYTEDSTSIKVLTIFDMIMHGIDIVAIGFAILNKRFKHNYLHLHHVLKNQLDSELYSQGMRLAERAFHTWQSHEAATRGASPPPPATFVPFSLKKAQEVFEGVKKSVDGYRYSNAVLEKLQWISFGTQFFRYLMKNTLRKRVDLVAQLVLEKASSILSFRSKAHCDINLQPISRVIGFLSPLVNSSSVVSFLAVTRTLVEVFRGPLPRKIGESHLLPFALPSDMSSWHYDKIPEKYHNQAPFNEYQCAKTGIPITQALIIKKDNKSYIFEKEALIDYIKQNKESLTLIIPDRNIPPDQAKIFAETDVYVDLDFNAQRLIELAKLTQHHKAT